MSALVPPWVLDDAWRDLTPPAYVLKLGALPRAPEKILSATVSICVTEAKRYQPDASGTKCNIALADLAQIVAAPIPHWFDLATCSRSTWSSSISSRAACAPCRRRAAAQCRIPFVASSVAPKR